MTRAEYLKLRGWTGATTYDGPVLVKDGEPGTYYEHEAFVVQAERDLLGPRDSLTNLLAIANAHAQHRIEKLEAALREIAEAQVNGLSNVALFALEDK